MANALGTLFGDIAAAIREKTGDTAKMKPAEFPSKISGISAGGGDVCYVTFMSRDGSVEYGKKAVAVGDDCADPIARGVFSTPTRESTAQYNYDFAGWATTANGALDANALKSVEEDRTVYANFAAILRYYTITYYDGNTVLKTESLAYGSMPSYEAEKDGYGFGGWNPALAKVTGNASYTAVWLEKLTFANASWSQIAEIAAAGEAQDYFKVGDTKNISFTAEGKSITMPVIIAGFDHDDLADGSGKAAMSIVCGKSLTHIATKASSDGNYYAWDTLYLKRYLNTTLKDSLPSDLQSAIKTVTKVFNNGRDSSGQVANRLYTIKVAVWTPSSTEVGFDGNVNSTNTALEQGAQYPLFTNNASRVRQSAYYTSGTGKSVWLTRSMDASSLGRMVAVGTDGSYTGATPSTSAGTGQAIVFGFCI